MMPFYKSIGLLTKFNYLSAALAYIIMALSWKFIQGNLTKAALMGLFIYGVYVFTLCGIYSKYTFPFALKELMWGITLYTSATYLTNKLS